MNTKRKWSSYQAYVDHITYRCLSGGIRKRDKIIEAIQIGRLEERDACYWLSPRILTGLEEMNITKPALIIAVSRTTSRKDSHGHRDIWCVPKEHRYVSITRLKELVESSDARSITAEEIVELKQSREDLHQVAIGLEEKARVMFADALKVRNSAINAHCAVLDFGKGER